MALNTAALIDRVVSHASRAGLFDQVQGHEPKSQPSNSGLTFAVFLAAIGPARQASGLSATSARVELTGRIYRTFMVQPEDLIDPMLAHAVDVLLTAYSADFDLSGLARNVDLLGAHGTPLGAKAGYQNIDKQIFRCIDITIPIIVSDVWSQGA